MESSVEKMKKRHHIDPFTIRKGARSELFYNPSWIPSANKSFEIKMYQKEMQYLQILKFFVTLTETNATDKNNTIDLKINTKQIPISPSFGMYQNMKYISSIFENKYYTTTPETGVLAQLKKNSSDFFLQLHNDQVQIMLISFFLILINAIVSLILVMYLVFQMSQYYLMASKTSQNFIKLFEKNVIQLKICVQEMTHFSKNSLSQIVRQGTGRKLRSRKRVPVQSLKKIKTTADFAVKLSKASKRRINIFSIVQKDNLQKETFFEQLEEFGKFYALRLVYPIVRMIVLIGAFYSIYSEGRMHSSDSISYHLGLTELTNMNIGLLNMFTTNIFISYSRQPSSRLFTFPTSLNQ
jgi:hypothetical protein